jgi:hypothetical protein
MVGLLRILRPGAGQTDWFFCAFVVLALVVFGAAGAERLRYRSSIRAFAVCAAHADAECADVEIDRLRDLDPGNARTMLAGAELDVLKGDAVLANADFAAALKALLPKMKHGLAEIDLQALPTAARGDAMLLQGDLRAMAGDARGARAAWDAAAPDVDEAALVQPRRDRLDAAERNGTLRATAYLVDLRDELRELTDLSVSGQKAETAERATAVRELLEKVENPKARAELSTAVAMLERVAASVSAVSTGGGTYSPSDDGPPPPVEPTEEELKKQPWRQRTYQMQMDEYWRSRAAATRSHADALSRQSQSARTTMDNAMREVEQAKKQIEQGLRDAGTGVSP